MDTQRVTLRQLEDALPAVLAQPERDLIKETRAGRVLVVMQAPDTTVDLDGGFTWMVRAIEPQAVAQITGVDLVRDIARCRETNCYPIVLFAEQVKLIGLRNDSVS